MGTCLCLVLHVVSYAFVQGFGSAWKQLRHALGFVYRFLVEGVILASGRLCWFQLRVRLEAEADAEMLSI